jgi:hypothetical protein
MPMDGPSMGKEAIIGIDPQSSEGAGDDTGVVWCPFSGDTDLGPKGNMMMVDQADTVHQHNVAIPEGKWWEGRVPLTFRPVAGFLNILFGTGGVLNSASRDAYNNPPPFTIFLADKIGGARRVRAGRDCRPGTWRLRSAMGKGSPVEFEMSLQGKADFSTAVTPSGSFGRYYLFAEAIAEPNIGGAGASVDVNLEEWEISGDEHLLDIDSQFRSGMGNTPYRMDCEGDQEVTISLTRDRVDTLFYDLRNLQVGNADIDTTNSLSLQFRFVAGGVTCTLLAARCAVTGYEEQIPGSKIGKIKEVVTLRAAASADGATAALQTTVS